MIPARRWVPWVLVVAAFSGFGLVSVQESLDASFASYRTEEQTLYLSSGEWIKRMAMGYNGLLACVYWTRAVQHYGRQHLARGDYPLLYPLLDITTTLDPEMLLPYRFGALFLTEEPPGGPGRPDQALALLDKGIKANPDYWRFWYDVGFVYYRGLKDYKRASEAFLAGAKNPKAREFMRVMAAQIAAEGGSLRRAYFLWNELYESTDDPTIRQNAKAHLIGLRADLKIEYLEALLKRYRDQSGRRAESFDELVAAGMLRRPPLDPLDYPYRLEGDGRVQLDPQSPVLHSTLGRAR
jgi:tetratricopeptide (TPR) repeat protein